MRQMSNSVPSRAQRVVQIENPIYEIGSEDGVPGGGVTLFRLHSLFNAWQPIHEVGSEFLVEHLVVVLCEFVRRIVTELGNHRSFEKGIEWSESRECVAVLSFAPTEVDESMLNDNITDYFTTLTDPDENRVEYGALGI